MYRYVLVVDRDGNANIYKDYEATSMFDINWSTIKSYIENGNAYEYEGKEYFFDFPN